MIRSVIALACAIPAAAQAQATWTLSPQPIVSIGNDGTPATEFSRILGVMRLSDGRIAVVNSATSDVRIFGARGEHLKTFGRAGAGPGEFQGMQFAGRSGDTAFFYDYSLKRITVAALTAEPHVVKTIAFTSASRRGFASVDGRLSDGRWTVGTWISPGWDGPPGTYRMNTSVGVVPADAGGSVEWIAESPSSGVFVHNPTGNIKEAMVGIVGFSPNFMHTVSGASVVYGDPATDTITIQAGDQRRVARLPIPKRPITRAMAEAARDRELAQLSPSAGEKGRAWVVARYDAKNLFKDLPLFSDLGSGPDGEIWVEEYTATKQEPCRYLVLDASGTARAWVSVPAGFRIAEAGRDYVAGIQVDADDVETVRVYALHRR
jgi:hypothetical protein